MRSSLRIAPPLIWLLVSAGCEVDESGARASAAPSMQLSVAGSPAASNPPAAVDIDLGAIVRRARKSFRVDENAAVGGFIAASPVAHVRVSPSGLLSLTPLDQSVPSGGSSFAIETVSVLRDEERVAPAPDRAPRIEVSADGALRIERGGLAEEIEAVEQGVEQRWRFERQPSGRGDLRIDVGVRRARFIGRTTTGLHFASDGVAGSRTRYSHAAWIDARGERTDIEAVWAGDRIELRVSARVLDESAYPAVLDPLIAPEVEIDEPVRVRSMFRPERTRVESGGGIYLVAWTDAADRQVVGGGVAYVRGLRIRASDGAVLDAAPIVISRGLSASAALAWDGARFLVVYSRAEREFGGWSVYARHVGVDGSVGAEALISSQLGDKIEIAGGPGGFLAVWTNGSGALVGRRLSAAGLPLGNTEITIANGTQAPREPAVAFTAGVFLVGYGRWDAGANLAFARRVRASDGALLGGEIALSAGLPYASSPRLEASPTHFLAVYGAEGSINGRLIQASDGAVDPSPTALVSGGGSGMPAPNGNGWTLAFTDVRAGVNGLYARRIAPDLTPLDGPLAGGGVAVRTSTALSWPEDIAWSGSGHLLVWTGWFDQHDAIRIGADLSVPDPRPIPLALGDSPQIAPAAASAAGKHLVVWLEYPRGGTDRRDGTVFGARIRAADGAVLDPAGFEIMRGGTANTAPVVASDGSDFLVAAVKTTTAAVGVRAARVRAADGQVLDSTPIQITGGERVHEPDYPQPAAGAAAGRYLVAWPQAFADGRPAQIRVRTIDPATGALLDGAERTIGARAGHTLSLPSVACIHPECMVVWKDEGSPDVVRGGRVDLSSGAFLDPTDGLDFATAPPAGNPEVFATGIAADPGRYLLLFTQFTGGGHVLFGARIARNGAYAGAPIFEIWRGWASPSAVFDGSDFLVAWEVNPDRITYASRVQLLDRVRDVPPFVIGSSEMALLQRPAVATDGAGHSIIAWSKFDSSPETLAPRIFARVFINLPIGAPCSDFGVCSTAFCADGMCCDTSCGRDDQTDCQACSVAHGAAQDGVCGPIGAGAICRAAADLCDPVERCDGVSTSCPRDEPTGGCVPDAGTPDAAEPDATARDATTPDASAPAPDATRPDASAPAPDAAPADDASDGAFADAAPRDAGPVAQDGWLADDASGRDAVLGADAAPAPDAVAADAAGAPDAAAQDGSESSPDAGSGSDALAREDASSPPTDAAEIPQDAESNPEDDATALPQDVGARDVSRRDHLDPAPSDAGEDRDPPACACRASRARAMDRSTKDRSAMDRSAMDRSAALSVLLAAAVIAARRRRAKGGAKASS